MIIVRDLLIDSKENQADEEKKKRAGIRQKGKEKKVSGEF